MGRRFRPRNPYSPWGAGERPKRPYPPGPKTGVPHPRVRAPRGDTVKSWKHKR